MITNETLDELERLSEQCDPGPWVAIVEALRRELDTRPEAEWENATLPSYFEAFGALLGVVENSYVNTGQEVPTDPWTLVARALRGARHDE